MLYETIKDGRALKHFEKMLVCQGVSQKNAIQLCSGNYWNVLPKSKYTTILKSHKKGKLKYLKKFFFFSQNYICFQVLLKK